ncbi:unnamed protein product [Urochloa humidicola]
MQKECLVAPLFSPGSPIFSAWLQPSRWKEKNETTWRFHVRYPNKHHQIGFTMMDGVEFGPMQHPGGAEEQQSTGAEDGDNKMAVD